MSNESSGSENNSEPKRSKICSVCNDTSKNFHLNYGAPTCSSCRAFFRRAHRRTVTSVLVCQFGNACQITPETRRNCSKCRFDQCINVGMKVSLVLDEGQKQERFRRSLKKKHVDQSRSGQGTNLSRSHSFHSHSSSVSSSEDRGDDDNDLSGHFPANGNRIQRSKSPNVILPMPIRWSKWPMEGSLRQLWGKLVRDVKIDPIFMASLVQFHTTGIAVSEEAFFKHMATLRQMFLEFALNESQIMNQYQNQMNLRHSKVFVLCILAKYFTADLGSSQVAWLTLGHQSDFVPLVTLTQWSRSIRIFRNESVTQRFQALALQLRNFCKYPQSLPELAWNCLNIPFIHPYKPILDQLGSLEFLEDLRSPQNSLMRSTSFSPHEIEWIKTHLQLFWTGVNKIRFGDKLTENLFNIVIKGQPMGLDSAWHIMGIWSQRTLMILQQFEMFLELSSKDQSLIWETSFIPFYSVICSKIVSMSSLIDQLQFQARSLDRPHLRQLCAPKRLEDIKSPSITEFSVKSPFVSQEAARRMDQVYLDMEVFIADDLSFTLSLLSSLFLSATQKIPSTKMGRQGFMFQNLFAKLLSERARDKFIRESNFYQNVNELADLIQSSAL